jgi:hypothetical protein
MTPDDWIDLPENHPVAAGDWIDTPENHPIAQPIPPEGLTREQYLAWTQTPEVRAYNDQQQRQLHDTQVARNASARYADEGWLTHAARAYAAGNLFGWEPDAAAALTPNLPGGEPRDVAAEERALNERYHAKHPYIAGGIGLAGNIAGTIMGARALQAAPIIGTTATAAGEALNAIPALPFTGGAARAAQAAAAGEAAPITLGTAAATGGTGGAVQGALARTADQGVTPGNIAQGAIEGGLSGAVGGPVGLGVGRAIGAAVRPFASPEGQALYDAGGRPTIGQLVGGRRNAFIPQFLGDLVQRLENVASAVPVLGSFPRAAQQDAQEALNQTLINRGLSQIPREALGRDPVLPAHIPAGHPQIAHAQDTFNEAYDAALGRINMPHDFAGDRTPFGQTLMHIGDAAQREGLSPEAVDLIRHEARSVTDRLANSAVNAAGGGYQVVPGEALKRIQSGLYSRGAALRGSTNANQQQAAPFIDALRHDFADAIASTPGGEALQPINAGYAAFKIMQNAAGRAKTNGGIASPFQISAAVSKQDPSVSKGSFAAGRALLQDMAGPAAARMRDFANSGTPERAWWLSLGSRTGALAALAGGAHAGVNPAVLAAGAAIPAIYNQASQAALRAWAAGAPVARNALADAITRGSQRTLASWAAPQLGAYVVGDDRNALNAGGR